MSIALETAVHDFHFIPKLRLRYISLLRDLQKQVSDRLPIGLSNGHLPGPEEERRIVRVWSVAYDECVLGVE
jgi:hypothetical protein